MPGKILLVDDEVAVRNLYQLYLEANGYSVIAASSVCEALRILRKDPILLVIIDIFLQEENGLDLLKGIVAAGTQHRVIMISGVDSDSPLFQEALDNGAAGVFSKSLPLSRLLMETRRIYQEAFQRGKTSNR